MKYPQLVSMPSAVSDWLEEQLEARGIDAVVYTRYILSLLHSDTLDVIYSHEELAFNNNKETRRRKRFKCSYSDWWRYAEADAEKLKRTAAIECLTSATEESCGVESLIDELCARLNEIKKKGDNNNKEATNVVDVSPLTHHQPYLGLSPQELARKYYDAFPPLGRSSTPNQQQLLSSEIKKNMKLARNKRYGSHNNILNKNQDIDTVHPLKKPRPEMFEENENDDDVNLYDDLPVDITELLEDEDEVGNSVDNSKVEMMNLANMRNTGSKTFITSGTNLTSSIWSSDPDQSLLLDQQFSSINLDNDSSSSATWSSALSMFKLNHRKESSAFVEISPKNNLNPFASLKFGPGFHENYVKKPVVDLDKEVVAEDLLTSVHSHFIPINENQTVVGHNLIKKQYADGATFLISNNWDQISYKRTESGALYMENDPNMRKKYCEYRLKNAAAPPMVVDFVLKYLVCQNDKACQTEEDDAVDQEVAAVYFNRRRKDKKKKMTVEEWKLSKDADVVVPETCGDCQTASSNATTVWNTDIWENHQDQWDYTSLRDIWSGGEVCHSCLGRSPSNMVQTKLREDVSQDGDQLLNDLSTLQKTYMEDLPLNELSCDLTNLLFENKNNNNNNNNNNNLKRRRHSTITSGTTTMLNNNEAEENNNSDGEESWSFASRLEEDCLMQMSAIPTLRSVTL